MNKKYTVKFSSTKSGDINIPCIYLCCDNEIICFRNNNSLDVKTAIGWDFDKDIFITKDYLLSKNIPEDIVIDFYTDIDTNKWHKRFLGLAEYIANWSKDPSTKVGAVIVDKDNRIVSTGYNGFPKDIEDSIERYENRDIKYKIILHAEENAISYAKKDLTNCTLYISGLPPCAHCASLIIQSGIKKIVVRKQEIPERWIESMSLSKQILTEANIELLEI